MSVIKRKLRVVELYAGTGRSIAPYRERPEFEIVLLADVSRKARDTYLANHAGDPYALMDLAHASPAEIEMQAGGRIDVLLGCPPCQGFSDSGRRRIDDPRNDHIVRFASAICALRPLAFAMENVPLAAVSGQFGLFRDAVEGAGYEITAAVLNAAEYGSAQARQRLMVVGRFGRGTGLAVSLPLPTHAPIGKYYDYAQRRIRQVEGRDDALLGTTSSSRRASQAVNSTFHGGSDPILPTPTVSKVIGDLPSTEAAEAVDLGHVRFAHSEAMLAAMAGVPEGGRRDTGGRYYGAAYARLHGAGLAKTVTRYFSNAGSGRFWHPTENRSLTVREAARLQGFDDGFRFIGGASEANAWMIGNALDRALAKVSFEAVCRLL